MERDEGTRAEMEPIRVLVADPPWKFNDKLPEGYGGAERQYPCMTVDEICKMQIPSVANDSVLFL